MPRGGSTTHRSNIRAHQKNVCRSGPELEGCCGGGSYLWCVTGEWVNFNWVTKGRWSHHQSLGFFKIWLVTWLYL